MKMKFMTIILLIFCLAVTTQLVALCIGSDGVQNVGGDFGRAWLNGYHAQQPNSTQVNNNTTSNNTTANWGGKPKGATELKSNLVKPQNATATKTDWLGSSTITDSLTPQTDTSQKGTQQLTYFATGTVSPVHKIDASFNQGSGNPQPDSNGLINGVPAELYSSVGPAAFI